MYRKRAPTGDLTVLSQILIAERIKDQMETRVNITDVEEKLIFLLQWALPRRVALPRVQQNLRYPCFPRLHLM